jgi:DNA-binding NtrC family response regulator
METNDLREAVKEYKYRRYLRALREERGVATRAAKRIGVHRNTINRMMRDLGMSSYELKCGLGLNHACLVTDRRRSKQVTA